MSSNVHTVKQRSKESISIDSSPKKESVRGGKAPPEKLSPGPVCQSILEICKLDWLFVESDPTLSGQLKRVMKFMTDKEATPADIAEFETWRQAHHWTGMKGDSPPNLKQVGELWPQYQDWVKQGRPISNGQIGASKNGSHKQHTGPLQRTGESLDEQPTFNIYTGKTVPARGAT
jgi:hypothetical protein